MSEFATEFSISGVKTIQDLCNLFCKWVVGIKGTSFSKVDLCIDSDSSPFYSSEQGNEVVGMHCVHDDAFDLVGLYYKTVDIENITWVTEIVGRKNLQKFHVSVRVYRHSATLIHSMPSPKRPHFVKMLIASDWSARDGDIPLLSRAHIARENECHIVSDFLDSKFDNSLPVVYISVCYYGDSKYSVDPDLLAYRLGGIAHVIAEPSISFSNKMKYIFGDRIVFDGQIGIYWPNESDISKYSVDNLSRSALLKRIPSDVMSALAGRRSSPELTLQYVQELYSKYIINELRNLGSEDVNEYIRNFDAEIAAKDKRLEAAEAEILRLKNAEKSQYAKEKSRAHYLEMAYPKEKELYKGEFYEFLLSAVELSRRNSDVSYRRHHVMDAFLSSNNSQGLLEDLKSQIKGIFHDYKGMDGRIERELRDIGFSIIDSGKHVKLIFMNDSRYQFTIPKTPSDYRGSKNITSDIAKVLTG